MNATSSPNNASTTRIGTLIGSLPPHLRHELVVNSLLSVASHAPLINASNATAPQPPPSESRLVLAARALNMAPQHQDRELYVQFEYELEEALTPPLDKASNVVAMLQQPKRISDDQQRSHSSLASSPASCLNTCSSTSVASQIIQMATNTNQVQTAATSTTLASGQPTNNFAGFINRVMAPGS